MKINRRLVLSIVLAILAVYVIIYYWSWGEQLVTTIKGAARPFMGGALVAYVVNILMSGYEKAYLRLVGKSFARKFARGISMLLAYSTFALLIVFIIGTVLPELIASIQSMVASAPTLIRNLLTYAQGNKWLNDRLVGYFGTNAQAELTSQLTNYIQETLRNVGTILGGLITSLTGIFSAAINVFVSLIFSIYVLSSKESLGNQFKRLFQAYLPKLYPPFDNVRQVFHTSFRNFFVGQTIEATILGLLVFIGMQIFKFPYAPTISTLIGFTALLPVVGAYIGVTIGFILIMTQSLTQAVWFLIFVVVLQQFEGNLIYPRVVGNSVGLPGMWVILAITVGAALGGVLGMLLAVPFFAACYKLIRQDVRRREELTAAKSQ